jgi:hypothetical protein
MFSLVLALGLLAQDVPPPTAQPIEGEATAPDQSPDPSVELAEIPAEDLPPPPATDAPTLIAQLQSNWTSYAELEAELAGRRARERYLLSLMLPLMTRDDLDEGARGEILAEIGPMVTAVETENSGWAINQLDPERFVILWQDRPDAAAQILRWAGRDEAAAHRIVVALGPVAEAGLYDGPGYAVLADTDAMTQSGRQLYGTVEICNEGLRELAPLRAPGRIDERRAAIGLMPLEQDWAARLDADGEACEVSPSP